MTLPPPKIDSRTYAELVDEIEKLAQQFSQWKPSTDGSHDAGRPLIRIFGRMAMMVADRLNRVPEKHFLTFLDLIGTQIQSPQPARVPLTFFLVERNEDSPPLETFVPMGTQVSATASSDQEEVVFETEQDLVVTSTQLQAVYVSQPGTDQYSDRTDIATGKKSGSFPAFEGDTAIEHSLYLALDDSLVALPGPNKTLTLTFDIPHADTAKLNSLKNLLGDWKYWDGQNWQSLSSDTKLIPDRNPTQVQTTIANLPDLHQTTVDSRMAAWLQVTLKRDEYKAQTPQTISCIQATVQATGLDLLPDRCLLNGTALDLSKDFFPFGEQPSFNDTLYLAHARIFAIPRARVTLNMMLTAVANQVMPLTWEIWTGKEWTNITPTDAATAGTVSSWMKSGMIALTLPETLTASEVNGESNAWIRVRVNRLNYGKELPAAPASRVVFLTQAPSSDKRTLAVSDVRGFLVGDQVQVSGSNAALESAKITTIDPRAKTLTLEAVLSNSYAVGDRIILQIDSSPTVLQAPVIQSLKITEYSIDSQPLAACLTINNFQTVDRTVATNSLKVDDAFQPFIPTVDPTKPTLYLGFDQPFPNRAIVLYAQIAAATADEITAAQPPANPPRLVWEYSTSTADNGWVTLNVQDGTASFSQRGLVRFIGPSDFQSRQEFGQLLYWLRVRWDNADTSRFRIAPKLQRWLTNTIWAAQSTTLRNEILGSSDGNPDQRFYALQVPILVGHRLEVQESAFLPPGEVVALQKQSPDDVTVVYDDIGQIEAIWVRWQDVPDFYDSTPYDRHYVLDRLTGEIQFGDGQTGRIPPQGRQNIRMAYYRTGGGDRGNLPAQTITQLKTTIPYINQVTNLEPSAGGAEQESLEEVQERGPKSLRHRGQAITVQDFEDLTFAASTEVARVLAIVPTFSSSTTNPQTSNASSQNNASSQTSNASSLGPLDPDLWFDLTEPIAQQDTNRHNAAKTRADLKTVGQVQVIIVPHSSVTQPIPSLALVEQVEAYLRSRCAPTVTVQVVGPPWVQVSVQATVVPLSLEVADSLAQMVLQRLDQFLHPLTGGVAGQGWPFGREPHISDLYRVIEAIAQVAYVQSLTLTLKTQSNTLHITQSDTLAEGAQSLPDHFLVYSGSHSITLSSSS